MSCAANITAHCGCAGRYRIRKLVVAGSQRVHASQGHERHRTAQRMRGLPEALREGGEWWHAECFYSEHVHSNPPHHPRDRSPPRRRRLLLQPALDRGRDPSRQIPDQDAAVFTAGDQSGGPSTTASGSTGRAVRPGPAARCDEHRGCARTDSPEHNSAGGLVRTHAPAPAASMSRSSNTDAPRVRTDPTAIAQQVVAYRMQLGVPVRARNAKAASSSTLKRWWRSLTTRR